jgi:hypothetical protein
MNTEKTYTEANVALAVKFMNAWGYDGAKHYITKTIIKQRMTGNEILINAWESNLDALEAIAK